MGAAPGGAGGRRARVGSSGRLPHPTGERTASRPGGRRVPGAGARAPPVPLALPGERATPCAPAPRARPPGPGPASWGLGSPRRALSHAPAAKQARMRRGKERQSRGRTQGWDACGWRDGTGTYVGRELRGPRLGSGRAFLSGERKALGDREGKLEKLLAGKAQVSVPDALPTGAREPGHAADGHMPAERCCNPLRETWLWVPRPPPSLSPLLQRTVQCLPIATRCLLPGLWESFSCSS